MSNDSNNLFQEYFNSARDLISDRFSNPLIFSFVISWLITNYKIVMVIFTEQSEAFVFDYKIQLIQTYLNLKDGFIFPALVALAYTFAYPYLERRINKFTLERKMEIREDKNRIEKAQMRTPQEIEKIYQRHFSEIQTQKEKLKNAEETIQELRFINQNLQNQITNKDTEIANAVSIAKVNPNNWLERLDRLNPDEKKMLIVCGDLTNQGRGELEPREISARTGLPLTNIKVGISNFSDQHFISYVGNDRLILTADGNRAYMHLSKNEN